MIRLLMKILAIVIIFMVMTACNSSGNDGTNTPVKAELRKEADGYRVYIGGKPFYMKGAGFEGKDPSTVAEYGGNCIRTWRADDHLLSGKEKLDAAYENGLMVLLGDEVGRERHGFDYNDPEAVNKQLESLRNEVLKYKDHPALLAWGIGNELNLRATNPKVWDAVNDISEMIKATDPNHLTTTMLAGADPQLLNLVAEKCPALDFISIQLYGAINKLPALLEASNYKGAYALTEWGVTGHWESPKTKWGRPVEENSHQKALNYKERYSRFILSDKQRCLGSFVFLWGQKQERTPTWYGMFLETGEKTEAVDVMHYLWKGGWPDNRAPRMLGMYLNDKTALDDIVLQSSETIEAYAKVEDPENDTLTYYWEILNEVPASQQSDGGDFEPRPQTIYSISTETSYCKLKTPGREGEYRLFVIVKDGKNNAATANIPFLISNKKTN